MLLFFGYTSYFKVWGVGSLDAIGLGRVFVFWNHAFIGLGFFRCWESLEFRSNRIDGLRMFCIHWNLFGDWLLYDLVLFCSLSIMG